MNVSDDPYPSHLEPSPEWYEGYTEGKAAAEADLEARLASQELALRSCLLLASRNRKEEWARHVIRFCADADVKPSVLRTQIEGEGEKGSEA